MAESAGGTGGAGNPTAVVDPGASGDLDARIAAAPGKGAAALRESADSAVASAERALEKAQAHVADAEAAVEQAKAEAVATYAAAAAMEGTV